MARQPKKASAVPPEAVEVVGMVHPLGSGGGRLGGETLWTLRFSFALWRQPGGPLDERQLYLAKPGLTDAQLREQMQAIHANEVVRVRLRWTEPDGSSRLQAELLEFLGPDTSDAELLARAEQLRQPVTVEHPRLGTFTLNRALNWYETKGTWNGQVIDLSLSRDDCEDEPALFALAETLWRDQKGWEKRARDCAVEYLLELKNDTWLGEDEKEFTPTRFKKCLTLESIAIDPDGSFTFYYDDGNLFWGHAILVEGTITEGPRHATIAG